MPLCLCITEVGGSAVVRRSLGEVFRNAKSAFIGQSYAPKSLDMVRVNLNSAYETCEGFDLAPFYLCFAPSLYFFNAQILNLFVEQVGPLEPFVCTPTCCKSWSPRLASGAESFRASSADFAGTSAPLESNLLIYHTFRLTLVRIAVGQR